MTALTPEAQRKLARLLQQRAGEWLRGGIEHDAAGAPELSIAHSIDCEAIAAIVSEFLPTEIAPWTNSTITRR